MPTKRLHRPNHKPIPYHQHIAQVRPETNNVYAYCGICGRAMSNVPIRKLEQFATLAKVELTAEQLNAVGLEVKG